MSLLTAQGIGIRFGHRPILREVDLSVAPGQMVGLIGPNGAGKTTLLRALCGLLTPNTGTVALNGAPLQQVPTGIRARTMAYLPQAAESHWQVSVATLVALGRLPHQSRWGGLSDADRQAVRKAMHACDVAHLHDRTIDQISGGERARVMLARALAVAPDLLLADEPVAGLDLAHQLDVMERLRELTHTGASVLVVLHDLSLAARYCHRLVLLHQGRVAAEGKPDTVLTADTLADCYGVTTHRGAVDGIPYIVPLARTTPPGHGGPSR